jgi:hypothetical protein
LWLGFPENVTVRIGDFLQKDVPIRERRNEFSTTEVIVFQLQVYCYQGASFLLPYDSFAEPRAELAELGYFAG